MKKYYKNIGLILVVIGTLLLIATQIPQLSTSNTLLLSGLICNVAGAFLVVAGIKNDSLY